MKTHFRTQSRKRRHHRVRQKISGTARQPRLAVYRSLHHIYVQLIDDDEGHTLLSASSLDPVLQGQLEGKNKTEVAKQVGALIGQRAGDAGIKHVVFDRGGFPYHGRVKALAEAAREAGLEF